uniref:Uncharacterized protein n=1 Tax=Caenorhabditis japonica TaxID=281687 RepID=A0A8R1IUD1_CAEJA
MVPPSNLPPDDSEMDTCKESDAQFASPKEKRTRGAKRKNLPASDQGNKMLLERLNKLETAYAKLETNYLSLRKQSDAQSKEISFLKSELKEIRVQPVGHFPPLGSANLTRAASRQSPCPLYADVIKKNPHFSAVSNRVALVSDVLAMEQKSCTAVLENLNDSKTDDQSNIDTALISNFCVDSSLPTPTRIFRVDCKFENTISRPTKVSFKNQKDRDAFLHGFYAKWRGYSRRPQGPRPVRARRDMTREELKVLREVRKEAHEANVKEGLIKFAVHDLQIVELKKPRAFPSASSVSQSSAPTLPTFSARPSA